jgi:hypothetical protein
MALRGLTAAPAQARPTAPSAALSAPGAVFRAPGNQRALATVSVDPGAARAATRPPAPKARKPKAKPRAVDPTEQARADVDRLAAELADVEQQAAQLRDSLRTATRRAERLEVAAALRSAGYGERVFTRADAQTALGLSNAAITRVFTNNKQLIELSRADGDTPATYKLRQPAS